MSSNRSSARSARLQERLDGFFSLFQPTIDLAKGFLKTKSNAQELVLLVCARLDALASCMAREDEANRLAFTRLLVNYAGCRDMMESVSAGDLYYELGYHRWLAEGLIPKPGRLHRFSRLNDPIIDLLDRSGIPLTIGEVTGWRRHTQEPARLVRGSGVATTNIDADARREPSATAHGAETVPWLPSAADARREPNATAHGAETAPWLPSAADFAIDRLGRPVYY